MIYRPVRSIGKRWTGQEMWGLCTNCGAVVVLGQEDLQEERPCAQCKGKMSEVSPFVGKLWLKYRLTHPEVMEERGKGDDIELTDELLQTIAASVNAITRSERLRSKIKVQRSERKKGG